MRVIDEVLERLADGKWHNIDELEKVTGEYTWAVISFLHDYGFIRMNWRKLKVKASKTVHQFLKEINQIEVQEAWKRRSSM